VRTRAGLIATLAAGALMLVACGGDSAPTTSPTTQSPTPTQSTASPSPTQTALTGASVAIVDNAYNPAEVTVVTGSTVVWQHAGTAAHSVTASDGSFDSSPKCNNSVGLADCLQTGATFSHMFNTPGRFEYSCRIHGPLMAGVVVVT
jgi:plastocyanin